MENTICIRTALRESTYKKDYLTRSLRINNIKKVLNSPTANGGYHIKFNLM